MPRLPFQLARIWRRTLPEPQRDLPPFTVREVEERIPTIDELGNPRTVIRTRTLASFQGPTGVVEFEEARRHTLPGFGHVYPIADNQYIVFRDHMKLYAALQTEMSLALPVTTDVSSESEPQVEYQEMRSGSMTPLTPRDSPRSKTFAVVASLLFVTFVIWTLPPQREPSPSLSSFSSTASSSGIAMVRNGSTPAALPAPLLHEPQPMAPPAGASLVNDKNVAAHQSVARVAFAIRPWGEVYVNGKKQGPSPPVRELKLKPGRYTVEVRNGAYPPYRGTIDLRTKATAKVTHDFTKTETADAKESGANFAFLSRPRTPFLSQEWPP